MHCMPKNAATRRYYRRFFPTMSLYVVCIFITGWVFKHHHPTGPAAYMLAVLPALPIVALIVIIGRCLVEEKDEFQRDFLVQSMLWSMGATLSITTVWGFLENYARTPHLDLYLVFPIFCFFVGVSAALLKLRYR